METLVRVKCDFECLLVSFTFHLIQFVKLSQSLKQTKRITKHFALNFLFFSILILKIYSL